MFKANGDSWAGDPKKFAQRNNSWSSNYVDSFDWAEPATCEIMAQLYQCLHRTMANNVSSETKNIISAAEKRVSGGK